ncbi:polyhydroxyalkanoate synthesis regulator phasin [Bradyrhizobium sp. GM24.11]
MSCISRSTFFAVVVLAAFLFPPSARSAGFLETFGRSLLPSWPISSVGDPIGDDDLVRWRRIGQTCGGSNSSYAKFYSKPGMDPQDHVKNDPSRQKYAELPNFKFDSDYVCNDGDQTNYNGLLCASGDKRACQAVAEASSNGRFFRSPHRRWMWDTRCKDTKNRLVDDDAYPYVFIDLCANGFSPDMNLGVLLYTVATGDVQRYTAWLRWMDRISTTTELCKLDSNHKKIDGTCIHVEWPRWCEADLGYLKPGDDPGYSIDGRYGGVCMLRPWDALDFAVVNKATGTVPPSRMNSWEVESRSLIASSKEIMKALPVAGAQLGPIGQLPPLLIMSSVDGTYYPLHLDAERVLLRMMIRNPSLKMDNLPHLPGPNDIPGLMNLAASDASDPVSIKVAAATIAGRATWNPFYQLLAQGPTPAVRDAIVLKCPTAADEAAKTAKEEKDRIFAGYDWKTNAGWLWEKSTEVKDGVPDNDKRHGMGWDCVFVGNLYNKMRVKKPIVDELFALFQQYGNVVNVALNQATELVQLKDAEQKAAKKLLDESERSLAQAQDFVNEKYDEQKKATLDRLNELTSQISQLAQKQSSLEKQASDLRANAAQLPERVNQTVAGVCKKLGPFAPPQCQATKIISVVNQARVNQLNQVASLEQQISNIRNASIKDAQTKLKAANDLVAKLDTEVQTQRDQLQHKILQTAVNVARADLALRDHLLDEAKKQLTGAQKANAFVNGYSCVWKAGAKCDS